MISLRNLSLQRGTKLLFDQVNITLYAGQKVGFIGANGSGKSSLFSLLLGQLHPETGEVECPSHLTLAHVAQEIPTTTECDLDIYETYFINKYEPLHNRDKVFYSRLSFELPYIEPTTYEEYINKKIDKTKNLLSIFKGLPTNTSQRDSFIADIKLGGQFNYLKLVNNQLIFNDEQLNKEWIETT